MRQMCINSGCGKYLQGSALELLKLFKWYIEMYFMPWDSLDTFLFAVHNFFFSASMTGLISMLSTNIMSSFITLLKKKKKGLNERAMKNEQERLNNKATGHTWTLI